MGVGVGRGRRPRGLAAQKQEGVQLWPPSTFSSLPLLSIFVSSCHQESLK